MSDRIARIRAHLAALIAGGSDVEQETTWRGRCAFLLREYDTAYERGLRRGMAIARDYDGSGKERDVDWDAAEKQMEREIEEAKR